MDFLYFFENHTLVNSWDDLTPNENRLYTLQKSQLKLDAAKGIGVNSMITRTLILWYYHR